MTNKIFNYHSLLYCLKKIYYQIFQFIKFFLNIQQKRKRSIMLEREFTVINLQAVQSSIAATISSYLAYSKIIWSS